MQGKLFTQDFLERGITESGAWKACSAKVVESFGRRLENLLRRVPATADWNEATTKSELIEPILAALGWGEYLQEQNTSSHGRSDVPDYLLFADAEEKRRALDGPEDLRYRFGLTILEAKRWERPLDRVDRKDRWDPVTPSNQILRYLTRADIASDRRIKWGILTNGRYWRLYYQDARARAEDFVEFDLLALAGTSGLQGDLLNEEQACPEHFLRVFYLIFNVEAFLPQSDDRLGRPFHLLALQESRHWEAGISENLGNLVFEEIFPRLAQALINADPKRPQALDVAYLDRINEGTLTLLYRLLFLLYAEDRNLLPVRDRRYDDYSLRFIREDIARRIDEQDVFSTTATRYYTHLHDLFRAINAGEDSLGIPPYNGGLFSGKNHPLLEDVRLADAELAPLLDLLSRTSLGGERKWINYRDLSVQHLGSVYERLLERTLVATDGGEIVVRLSAYGRRGTGTYYTHDDLVKLIVRETIGPLIKDRVTKFDKENAPLASDTRDPLTRLQALRDYDPAAGILEIKVCDPAIGSGHFLVALVDYLADQVLEAIADATAIVSWAPEDTPYESPLTRRIADIRDRLLQSAMEHNWAVDPAQLDDRHIVRRMILKRVVHGVDKNPMAVELSKLALWLHTFTVGAPLSFLDHHLQTGDALFGERLESVLDALRERGAIFSQGTLTRIGSAADSMARIADLTDADIAEVKQSEALFGSVIRDIEPLKRLLDFWQAMRWRWPGGWPKVGDPEARALADLLGGRFGDLVEVVASRHVVAKSGDEMPDAEAAQRLMDALLGLARRERFLHWEVAFPGVWKNLVEGRPRGGFDAIIGNPPWDRMKLQEVEWFADRRPEIALLSRASDRKRAIAALQKVNDPLWSQYVDAAERAETAVRVARECGDYPLLATGDINLYSLFVERASALCKPEGIVGLLTPSGIASDKSASRFFRAISTGGHLACLFDFENKKVFFPDVDSRFKFCVLVFSRKRIYEKARCAFFLHDVSELEDPNRQFEFSSSDFSAVNPNTGTAPIFRSRRDADITANIYSRIPVLVDRRENPPQQVWPVRYATMFHMTNDSGLFKRRIELEDEGFYPVSGNRFQRGKEVYLPLYVGRMIRNYDHRAAGVTENEENVHNPALSAVTDDEKKQDPGFLPDPQYWVPAADERLSGLPEWNVAFRDIARTTDARTMISAVIPSPAAGNKLPLLLPQEKAKGDYAQWAPLVLANLNAMVFDYVARQKVQSTNINLFILEQLPMTLSNRYLEKLNGNLIAGIIRENVLRLSYTAEDLRSFAKDLGYDGDPFVWDEEDRRHRMARLDALFFHLYGLSRDDADYVMNTFPIVREQDEKQFGRFRTRDLVLGYMNAVTAGDFSVILDA